ncbi:hypothetical protein [Nocardioides lianchengensis]|uniref:Uncharacterized protein n=1 Tax=Nocardioides lianchengensis TaxID=1045774 RepID=A0A1G6LPB0_9ACTN|nr:hypothetical protein [Nocardioides lianchengensis]NYG12486.1 hypothetical protein [Nocardioides lianchengensis]SDC45112.1 hypothetical protein SAMN05421872_102319 [Nocardioides lianchengensis]
MTNLVILIARRTAAVLFPSVPPRDRARILAAMQDPYPQTPATSCEWEARPVAGHGPVDGAALPDRAPSTGSRSIPPAEDLRNWRAHPVHRWEFSDQHLDALVGRWKSATS